MIGKLLKVKMNLCKLDKRDNRTAKYIVKCTQVTENGIYGDYAMAKYPNNKRTPNGFFPFKNMISMKTLVDKPDS